VPASELILRVQHGENDDIALGPVPGEPRRRDDDGLARKCPRRCNDAAGGDATERDMKQRYHESSTRAEDSSGIGRDGASDRREARHGRGDEQQERYTGVGRDVGGLDLEQHGANEARE
jgi:hypothetical protein